LLALVHCKGRNWETPSEDPYLTGSYAAAFVKAAQTGKDPNFIQSIVTVKHWAAYSVDNYIGPDRVPTGDGGADRMSFNAVIDDYNFFDTYAPPFEMAVKRGHARGARCSPLPCNMRALQ
jgi:beta-D-xylosidase 4